MCFICVLFRMSSLYSRDFPPLISQHSSTPDFSQLKQGVDYIVTYTSSGEETHVLTSDLKKATAQVVQDGTFSPPSTRTRYSLTSYPVKRKFPASNRGNKAPFRGAPRGGANQAGFRGGNNNQRGGFQSQYSNFIKSPVRGSYSQAVSSPPRNNNSYTRDFSSPPPSNESNNPQSNIHTGLVRVIPNLDSSSFTLNSVYNEMKDCFTNVYGQINAHKTSVGNQLNAMNTAISDEGNGLDALALR